MHVEKLKNLKTIIIVKKTDVQNNVEKNYSL